MRRKKEYWLSSVKDDRVAAKLMSGTAASFSNVEMVSPVSINNSNTVETSWPEYESLAFVSLFDTRNKLRSTRIITGEWNELDLAE